MTKIISGIYSITNTHNGHLYIGSAHNFRKRWGNHIYYLNLGRHHSNHLQNAWNKYGSDAFEFNILEFCEPNKEVLLSREQYYLDILNPIYNVAKIAGSAALGKKLTNEQKDRISAFHKGKKHFLGHHHTDDAKARIGEASKGNKHRLGHKPTQETLTKMSMSMIGKNRGKRSKETCEKISKSLLGKRKGVKFSEEHSSKISLALKGRIISDEWRKKISESLKARHKKEKELNDN